MLIAWYAWFIGSLMRGILRSGETMAAEDLTEIVQALTPEEQAAVRRFIEYLKGRTVAAPSRSPFLQAADEFIAEHPDLLKRLAR